MTQILIGPNMIQILVGAFLYNLTDGVIIMISNIKVGDKVQYGPDRVIKLDKKYQNGMVKELVDDHYVRVVFNCDGDWDNYQKYTGALTPIRDLYFGWKE